jgi:tetratricopeptide (TPR) repeat protein
MSACAAARPGCALAASPRAAPLRRPQPAAAPLVSLRGALACSGSGRPAAAAAAPALAPRRRRARLVAARALGAAAAPLAAVPLAAHAAVVAAAAAASAAAPAFDLAEGLEAPVQALYLAALLGFLAVGAFLVARQVLIRRELEEAAKVLGERVRGGAASAEDQFELGAILLRKKLFTQAQAALERAKRSWDGAPEELAQVHNALGYALFNQERLAAAVAEYQAAVALQPGYVTAWNNLGDAQERLKDYAAALAAYSEALAYAPDNAVARARADYCRTRLDRAGGARIM